MKKLLLLTLLAVPLWAEETATLRVYRFHDVMWGHKLPVFADGKLLTKIARGRVAEFALPAGRHEFQSQNKEQRAVVNMRAGETYFLRVNCGDSFERVQVCAVAPESANAEIANLKPAAPAK